MLIILEQQNKGCVNNQMIALIFTEQRALQVITGYVELYC